MSITPALLALLVATLPSGLAGPTGNSSSGLVTTKNAANESFLTNTYFSGPWDSFPAMETWVDYNDMFNSNTVSMMAAGSTQKDVTRINTAITNVALEFGIDPRVILGITMEESHGGVGVVTTWNADGNPTGGLMQASGCNGHDGERDLDQEDITYMIHCGAQHYKTNLGTWGDHYAPQSVYPALREYNSGSVVPSDLSTAPNGVGNPAYVSDIANRFLGWVN